MTDEEALFQVWFILQRIHEWEKTHAAHHPVPEDYMLDQRELLLKGWLGRASTHVRYARGGQHEKEVQP